MLRKGNYYILIQNIKHVYTVHEYRSYSLYIEGSNLHIQYCLDFPVYNRN